MDFSKDDLGRQKFADLLIEYSTSLASAAASPAGRVIAVDAPWGSGKSWVAKRLPAHFQADKRVGACVYIDAFQFDYHQDPFSVVTSAILDEFKEHNAESSGFRVAAAKVLKVSLPALGKGLIKVTGRAIGIDAEELFDSALEAGADASEKAIEHMLDTFSQTKATTEAFHKKLTALANTSEDHAPLIVVVDELDRCRPSYALELLERVKHLFDVPNVVFLFFVHTPALHSAIRKTYGHEINPTEYLRKFFAITVGLPVADKPSYSKSDQSQFLIKFLEAQYPIPTGGLNNSEKEFRVSLICFAPVFNASFRDLENVMLLWLFLKTRIGNMPTEAAYSLLLKVRDQPQLKALQTDQPAAFQFETARLGKPNDFDDGRIDYMRDAFFYGVAPATYMANADQSAQHLHKLRSLQDSQRSLRSFQRAIANLELEYVRL